MIQAFILPEMAVVSVDTEMLEPNGNYSEASKLVTIPHLGAVLAFRGVVATFASTLPMVFSGGLDFDGVADRMPFYISIAMQQLATLTNQYKGPLPYDLESAEFLLVGFSRRHGRMVGIVYAKKSKEHEIEVSQGFTFLTAPACADVTLPDKLSDGFLRQLANKQISLVRDGETPEAPCGGRLITAYIYPESILIKQNGCLMPRPLTPNVATEL